MWLQVWLNITRLYIYSVLQWCLVVFEYNLYSQCLKEDIRRLTNDRDSKFRDFESSLKEKNQRLETYESLEHELDDVVMQAAESMQLLIVINGYYSFLINAHIVENEQDAERVLFSFGFGTSIPSTSRRRMQQRYMGTIHVTVCTRTRDSVYLYPISSDTHGLIDSSSTLKT